MTTTFSPANPHAGFLSLLPAIERRARATFRGRPIAEQEEATAVAVAAAFVAYVRLANQGRDPARDFPATLVSYAVLHSKSFRQVGSRTSAVDALSPLARRKQGFRVESLSVSACVPSTRFSPTEGDGRMWDLKDRLTDNTRTAVPEQVAFRLDFPEFVGTLGARDRAMAGYLAMGHSANAVAGRFGLTAGRVSQLRREWRKNWRRSQGEEEGGENAGTARPTARSS